MAKRDPNTTAKNQWIKDLKKQLADLLPDVLAETGIASQQSLNAIIGSKHDAYFDLKNDVFVSPDDFSVKWHAGLDRRVKEAHYSSERIEEYRIKSPSFAKYLKVFLKRSFLNHFNEWSRVRPAVAESCMWIGQNNADYGLLVTPRFRDGQWENDKSEIRAVKYNYWTIGHVLSTGLVVPSRPTGRFEFDSPEKYLDFFEDVIVRKSGSPHEREIASCYREYVLSSSNPIDIPLLIPEFRYEGLLKKHVYRLDFTIVNPYNQTKIGIELSPWSTHGYLSKTRTMTQAQINEAAKDNFEREMSKHRSYFKKHNIFVLIYTDANLSDCKKLFDNEIMPYLNPEVPKPAFEFEMARRYGLT